MQSHLKRSLRAALSLFLLSSVALSAKVTMCSVFGDHMVLQRLKPIPVFGTDTPGEAITVTLGSETKGTIADKTGYWQVALPERAASAVPTVMTVVGSSKLTFTDVLIGDVWVAGGQSNMDYAFFWGDGILDWAHQMAIADHPTLRTCKVNTVASATPQDAMQASWVVCTPKLPGSKEFSSGIEYFTCTGYFFALEMSQSLGIPIGLINSSDGGTMIEAWMDPASVAKFPDIEQRWEAHEAAYPAAVAAYNKAEATWLAARAVALAAGLPFTTPGPTEPLPLSEDIERPSGLYNAMINPFLGYGLRGVIWYQGENNVLRALEYRKLFPALINGWRADFGEGEIPFYWCQLANFEYDGNIKGTNWAYLREAQNMTLSVANTGQAVTFDIGNVANVHLEDKEDVGRRLALLALNRSFDIKSLGDAGPVFDHATLSNGQYQVFFKNAPGGLFLLTQEPWEVPTSSLVPLTPIGGFTMAGADQVFHAAVARLSSNRATVYVTCPAVPKPVALRYGFVNGPEGLNLGNVYGLPTPQFRTDTWLENPAETQP